jgi:hypothetical protein
MPVGWAVLIVDCARVSLPRVRRGSRLVWLHVGVVLDGGAKRAKLSGHGSAAARARFASRATASLERADVDVADVRRDREWESGRRGARRRPGAAIAPVDTGPAERVLSVLIPAISRVGMVREAEIRLRVAVDAHHRGGAAGR